MAAERRLVFQPGGVVLFVLASAFIVRSRILGIFVSLALFLFGL